MTKGSPTKTIAIFALPMILGNVFQQLYNIVDSVVVGNYVGSNALAAVGTAFPVTFMGIAVAMGLTMGCSVVISQLFGAGKIKEMRKAIYTSAIFLLMVSVAVSAIGLVISGPILRLLNTPDEIFAASKTYLAIFFGSIVFMFAYNAFSAMFRALGDSKTPLYFLIVATIINIVLDLLFVISFGMGVAGVAWATLISQAVSGLLCYIYMVKRVAVLRFEKDEMAFDKNILKSVVKFGIPSSIQQFIVSFGMLAIQGLVNSYGTDVIAGYTSATKIDSIGMMPMMNLSMALSTYVAQNIGAGQIKRVKQGFNSTLVITCVICLATSALILPFGKNMINMFVDSEASANVIEIGAQYLQVVSAFYILFGIMFTANGVLRGSGDLNFFMFISIFNLGVRVAAAYALAYFIGYEAIWWSIPVGWAIAASMSLLRYYTGGWKNKAIVGKPPADAAFE